MNTLKHVVYATDKNYWMHLYVSLYSLMKNNPDDSFKVYILTDNADDKFISNLSFLYGIGNLLECNILKIESSWAESFPVAYYFTEANYYRLFIGRLLPDDIKKILYLDCDTIIEKPLIDLYETDFEEHVIAAAPDYPTWANETKNRLNLPENSICFNSGVLLINLEKWRSMNIEEKLISYINENNDIIKSCDQDALNAVFCFKYKQIKQEYNFMVQLHGEINIEPSVIHYTWEKPWQYMSNCSCKNIYWKYLRETPYRNYYEVDRNFKNILVKTKIVYSNRVMNLKIKIISLIKKSPFLYEKVRRLKRVFIK